MSRPADEFDGRSPGLIRVLALSYNQHGHFEPLYGQDDIEIIESAARDSSILSEIQPDIVVTLSNDWWVSSKVVAKAKELRIPTLYVLDGVLEWRHQWENPRFGAGGKAPYAQIITADKVACPGWRTARILESWGAIGKCEVIGIPRFDNYLHSPVERRVHEGPKRLLVMTANTPGFSEMQIERVADSLKDIRDAVELDPEWAPIWRIRGGLDRQLGLKDEFPNLSGMPLGEVFAEADAVVSTPSTAVLEAMLSGLPTAIVDYANCPPYLVAAWMITASGHIRKTLKELASPSAARLAFQHEVLHDNLACFSPATPRMVELIHMMADLGRDAKAGGEVGTFPSRMVEPELGGYLLPMEDFDFEALYPGHPVFSQKEIHQLQFDLIQAGKEIGYLRGRLDIRSPGYWIGKVMTKLYRKFG